MKNKKINIGLIGYGVVGERRLNNLPKFFNLISYHHFCVQKGG